MPEDRYRSVGLMVGIEIHQQLSTGKLFCSCPCNLSDIVSKRFERALRPSVSEMGEVDRAALEEAQKKLRFTYESTDSDCLVEADEEPPHSASDEAIKTTLLFSKMVGATPVDEIVFMRKIVIDGSNTSGFQRTALVSMKGKLEIVMEGDGLSCDVTPNYLEKISVVKQIAHRSTEARFTSSVLNRFIRKAYKMLSSEPCNRGKRYPPNMILIREIEEING